jgi:hypothetical protein
VPSTGTGGGTPKVADVVPNITPPSTPKTELPVTTPKLDPGITAPGITAPGITAPVVGVSGGGSGGGGGGGGGGTLPTPVQQTVQQTTGAVEDATGIALPDLPG